MSNHSSQRWIHCPQACSDPESAYAKFSTLIRNGNS